MANVLDKYGSMLFIVGALLALGVAIFPALQVAFIALVLVIVGLLIGIANVTKAERVIFMVAAMGFALLPWVAGLSPLTGGLGNLIDGLKLSFTALFMPAFAVVATRSLYDTLSRK